MFWGAGWGTTRPDLRAPSEFFVFSICLTCVAVLTPYWPPKAVDRQSYVSPPYTQIQVARVPKLMQNAFFICVVVGAFSHTFLQIFNSIHIFLQYSIQLKKELGL